MTAKTSTIIPRDHLAEHSFGYWQHCKHALSLNVRLLKMLYKSTIHGFFPNSYADDGPIEVYNIYHEIKELPNVKKLYDKLDNERGNQ
tara:strand:- start:885 stop:1148 length:264 start_codon:yes stop_codon:yes gene_type:complete